MRRIPNFFIVGAPKAGTTALYEYLRRHPLVCMSSRKEPHYFAMDFPDYPSFRSRSDYLKLFQHCQPEHYAVGEASVLYLCSDVALGNIRRFNPDARIIVMLRNPVDLVFSLHGQALFNFNEDEADFERAWYLQAERAQGRNLPPGCRESRILQYRFMGSLGLQVKRLYRVFPREQVLLVFFDDFVTDSRVCYEQVLSFLQLPYDGRKEFPVINESSGHRWSWLGWFTQTPPRPLLQAVRFARQRLGINIARPLEWVRNLNSVPVSRPPLSGAFRHQLQREFEDDILQLEELSGRDLSRWLRSGFT
jgi:hypothetical protein